MKRLGILAFILLPLLLIGCGYSQAELQNAQDEGYQTGYDDGFKAGLASTPQDINAAYRDGYNQGYENGYNRGFNDGYIQAQSEMSLTPKYVGSINSNIYHYPWCMWAEKILPENEIWFDSPQDAQAHGYRPCKVCNPP